MTASTRAPMDAALPEFALALDAARRPARERLERFTPCASVTRRTGQPPLRPVAVRYPLAQARRSSRAAADDAPTPSPRKFDSVAGRNPLCLSFARH
jgi:hypothetical protein